MAPFRDARAHVRARAEALRRARLAELRATPRGWRSVYVRRRARIGFGVTGTVAAMLVAGVVLTQAPRTRELPTGGLTALLALAWLVASAAYVASGVVATLALRRRLRGAELGTGDPFDVAVRAAAPGPQAIERRLAARHARASWIAPLCAVALLGPYSVQLLVLGLGFGEEPAALDAWLRLTAPFAIHVHLAGVYVAWRFPRTLDVTGVVGTPSLVALFPLLIVSMAITAVTAGALALLAFVPMRRIIRRERAAGLDPDGDGEPGARAGADDADLHRAPSPPTIALDGERRRAPQ